MKREDHPLLSLVIRATSELAEFNKVALKISMSAKSS